MKTGRFYDMRFGEPAELYSAQNDRFRLYLFTPNKEAWYSKLGWNMIEHTIFNKVSVTVMLKELCDHLKNCT